MSVLSKVKTMFSIPPATGWLFIKAVFLSAAVRFTMLFLPFSRVLKWLGVAQQETSQDVVAEHAAYAQKVKTAVWLCNKYTFWKTECYVQALTAKILLRQRAIPATLYIGFLRSAEGQMKGHAWLRCGKLIVTGNKTKGSFQVHSFFS